MTSPELIEQSTDGCPPASAGKVGSELREHLTGILAHELRHPLAEVLTSLHVLRHSGADESVAQQAQERAERQAWYMAQILGDMLAICRGRRGLPRLHKERVDLAAVVADALAAARPFLTRRGHHLTVSLPPQPVSLAADAPRLTQVLTKLLTNAGRYTDPGGEIGLAVEVAGGAVVLRVRDNGTGIDPDVLPRIFGGVGLALVKTLVELHGGTIAAHSRGPGTGAEFVVHLPSCAPVRS
jgi:signal transduction histidine kinase